MQDLKITIVQTDLAWCNTESNLKHFDKLIDGINEPTDLIVLPEMFSTGFTMQPQSLAEKLGGRTLKWMLSKARDKQCAVMGSYIVKEGQKYYNRLYFVLPDGNSYFYDKKHLFRMAGEDRFFTPGNKRLVVTVKGWKLSTMICYDLRFPVWCRNSFDDGTYGYDCQVFIANWPMVRRFVWETLLASRAIENQSYVVGVNRIGSDGNNIAHSGDSMILDPFGSKISQTMAQHESVETITLSADKLKTFRNKVTFGLDWDKFKLI